MEPTKQKTTGNELDLMQIAEVVLRNFWIIVLSGVLVGLCALFVTKITATPTYTSSTKLYVLSRSEDEANLTSGDLQLSAVLAGDYAQLIKDRTVTESVISQMSLVMSSEELAKKISVEMPESGRIITISVSDADPYMASKLATVVRDTAALHIKEVMGLEAVNVVEDANIPEGQNLANYKRNGMMGVLAGAALAVAILMVQFMMNDTIRNEEDVKRYLGTSVLGVIPVMKEEDLEAVGGRRKGR